MSFCYFDFEYEVAKQEEYNELRKNEQEILDNIFLLANELGIKDEISICNLYSYLLYSGRLSQDKKFKYSTNVIEDDYTNITLGSGCCRNIADGLKGVLDRFNIKSCVLTTTFNTSLFYDYSKDNDLHDVNLVFTNDGYFIYDATNMLLFKVSKRFLKSLNSKYKLRVIRMCKTFDNDIYDSNICNYLKYIGDYSYSDKFGAKNILDEIKNQKKVYVDEALDSIKKDNIFLDKCEEQLDSFYNKSRDNIKRIANIIK